MAQAQTSAEPQAAALSPPLARTLHLGGTAFGAWPALADALGRALAAATPAGSWRVVVHAAPPAGRDGGRPGDGAADNPAEARWVIFVESPAAALQRALAAAIGEPGDPAGRTLAADAQPQALQAWRASARRWLDHAQARRSRCLLADTAEAWANPDGLAAVLAGWLDVPLEAVDLPTAPAADPLLQMLAEAAVAADRRAADLHAELQASCLPLPGQPEAGPAAALDASAALQRCLQLAALEAAGPARDEERAQLLMALHETQLALEQAEAHATLERAEALRHGEAAGERIAALSDQLAQAQTQQAEREAAHQAAITQATDEQGRLRGALDTAQREHGLLLSQLHQAQEELEALFQREAEARERGTALAAELQQQRDAAAALQSAATQAADEQRRTQDALARAQQEGSLLLGQLHQVQQALEDLLLREQQAVAAGQAHEAAAAAARQREQQAGEQARQAAAALERRVASAHAETARLQAQLAQMQHALDTVSQQARAAAAEHVQVCAQLNQRWQAEVARSAEAARAAALVEASTQAAAQADAAIARAADAAALARENDALSLGLKQRSLALEDRLRQALQAHETLSLQLYEALQSPGEGAAAGLPAAPGQAPRLRVEGARVVQARDTAPHRELVVELEQLGLGGRTLPRLTAKLVEHEGRPGLALLQAHGGGEQALGQWQPSGTEDGREIVLLIPRDAAGRERLERLGASDWQTVQGLVQLLEATVGEAGPAIGGHWPVVAARLRTQLQALRPRLRYDRLDVAAAEGTPPGLDIRLDGVLHGERPLAPIRLHWRPQAASDRLVWLLDAPGATAAALGAWPTLANGTLAPQMALPVGPGLGRMAQWRHWATLAPADRDLLLALMDALLAAAERADAAPGLSAEVLRRSALALRSSARRAATASRLGLMAHGALRRREGPR